MAFLALEQSEHSGKPQECFLFEYLTEEFAYTSSKNSIELNATLFSPVHIQRSALRNENDMFKTTLTITVKSDDEVALKFRTWLEGTMLLTVFRQHYGDGDPVVLWSGKVASCKWTGNTAELSCVPLYTSLKKLGLLRIYQRACPHIQYGDACRLVKAEWEEVVTTTNISEGFIEFSGSFSVDYFKGGSTTIGSERRLIASSDMGSITLLDAFVDASIGDVMTLLPGCQHSSDICRNTFDNELNNGGFYFIPSKNPFMVTLLG